MAKIEERKNSWLDFYAGEKRALVQVQMDYGKPVFPAPDTMDKFFNHVLNKYRIQMDCLDWLDDDRVPCISALMGTDIFARAFGSPVVYPMDTMPFARPFVFSASDAAKIKKPVLEKSTLMETFEFGLKLQKAAEPGILLQLPDIQSPMDIAALIWDKTDFFMALYDEPQAVKDLTGMIAELMIEFLDLWFKTFGKEFIAHYPDYYMPFGLTVSEDEIGSISTEQFVEFCMPGLCQLSEHFGGKIGIHCCANSKHQWPVMKTIPGMIMLNINQSDSVVKEATSFFKDGPGLINEPHQSKLTDFGAKVVLQGFANSKDKALEVLTELREYSKNYICL